MSISIFYNKNNRKHLEIAVKCMEDGKNRLSFIKDVEIKDRKSGIIYSALSIIIKLKNMAQLKVNPKILSIHYHKYRPALVIHSFFKGSIFLMKNKIYLIS